MQGRHKATRESTLADNLLILQSPSFIPIGWFPGEWRRLHRAQARSRHAAWIIEQISNAATNTTTTQGAQ